MRTTVKLFLFWLVGIVACASLSRAQDWGPSPSPSPQPEATIAPEDRGQTSFGEEADSIDYRPEATITPQEEKLTDSEEEPETIDYGPYEEGAEPATADDLLSSYSTEFELGVRGELPPPMCSLESCPAEAPELFYEGGDELSAELPAEEGAEDPYEGLRKEAKEAAQKAAFEWQEEILGEYDKAITSGLSDASSSSGSCPIGLSGQEPLSDELSYDPADDYWAGLFDGGVGAGEEEQESLPEYEFSEEAMPATPTPVPTVSAEDAVLWENLPESDEIGGTAPSFNLLPLLLILAAPPPPPPDTCCFCLSWGRDFGNHCSTFKFDKDCAKSKRYLNVRTKEPALPKTLMDEISSWKCGHVKIAFYHHGHPPMCPTYFKNARACISTIKKHHATGSVALVSVACNIYGNKDLLFKEMKQMRDECPEGFECRVAAHVTLGLLPVVPRPFTFTNPDGCNVPYNTAVIIGPVGKGKPSATLCVPFCSTYVGKSCHVDALGVPCMPKDATATTRPRLMRCLRGFWQDAGEWKAK